MDAQGGFCYEARSLRTESSAPLSSNSSQLSESVGRASSGAGRWGWAVLYWFLGLPSAVALAIFTFASVGLPSLADDAFILLVYVRHLLADRAIYWNVGEGHVDGCTSMLDVLVKAGLAALFPHSDLLTMDWASTIAMIVLGAAVVLAFFGRLARREKSVLSFGVALLASWAIAGNVAAMEGASFLLETPLFLLALFASFFPVVLVESWTNRKLVVLGVVWAFTMMSRPEAMALMALPSAFLVLWHWREASSDRPRVVKKFLIPAAVAYGLFALYLSWHTWYFGSWAPNTYYAKHSESRILEIEDGIGYVGAYMQTSWGKTAVCTVVLAPLLAFLKGWRSSKDRWLFVLFSLTALANLGIVIVSGGDCYFGLGRFLAGPSVLALVALGIAAMSLKGVPRIVPIVPLTMLLVGNVKIGFADATAKSTRMKAEWPPTSAVMFCDVAATEGLRNLGIRSFAQTDQQRFKYVADWLRVIDASGLNDRIAAHTKVEGRVGFGKGGVTHAVQTNAESFSYGYMFPYSPQPMARLSSREIIDDDGTRARYVGARFGEPYPEDDAAKKLFDHFRPASLRACGGWFNFWLRKDLAETMQSRNDVVVGPSEPETPLSFDDPSRGAIFDGFEPTDHRPDGDVKAVVGKGTVRLTGEALRDDDRAMHRCVIGVTLAPGSAPVDLVLDGTRLEQRENSNRFTLPQTSHGEGGSSAHTLSVEAKDTANARVLLKGLFVDCSPRSS